MVYCDHAFILHRYGHMTPQKLDGQTHVARMDAQVILYFVQYYALHWTDKNALCW